MAHLLLPHLYVVIICLSSTQKIPSVFITPSRSSPTYTKKVPISPPLGDFIKLAPWDRNWKASEIPDWFCKAVWEIFQGLCMCCVQLCWEPQSQGVYAQRPWPFHSIHSGISLSSWKPLLGSAWFPSHSLTQRYLCVCYTPADFSCPTRSVLQIPTGKLTSLHKAMFLLCSSCLLVTSG